MTAEKKIDVADLIAQEQKFSKQNLSTKFITKDIEKSPIFIFTLSFRIMCMGVELAGLHVVLAFILINRF